MSALSSDCVLGNTSLVNFDALVIGSGAGGSAAAHVLAKEGRKVLVLEAGNNYFPGLDQPGRLPWSDFSNDEIKMPVRGLVVQDPVLEPRTFRQTENGVASPHPDVNVLTRNVGGAAVISTVSYPRFNVVDFRIATALREAGREFPGTSFADWPFSYEELEPFYYETEVLSGIAGASEGPDADPYASWRSKPFPLPPQPEMYVGRVLANGARSLGYSPFNYPSAVVTRANVLPDDDRTPCVSCGGCAHFGCPRNAKGSPAVTTLRRALLTGNCQLRYNCHVARLLLNPSKDRVTGVEYFGPDGGLETATADQFVLAASPIESVRLCFLSDLGGAGVGNSSGHLGRHLMFHYQPTAAGFFRQRLHGERGRSVTNGMSDFRGVAEGGESLHPDADGRPLGGIVEFSTSSEPILSATEGLLGLRIAQSVGVSVSLKDMLVESPFQAHIGVISMMGEDAPQFINRVDLDPSLRDVFGLPVPRVTYQNSPAFEIAMSEVYTPKMLDILEAAGAEYGLVQPPVIPSTSRHIMGGLRMATDPSESVCDAYGKFHDLENLYCADGSVFPTASGYNPTPTIIAVALRTAGAMVYPGEPEKVLQYAAAGTPAVGSPAHPRS